MKIPLLFILLLVLIPLSNAFDNSSAARCDYSLSIIPKDKFFEDRIYFSFKTNASDYIIEYWIESPLGEIVKPKYNTTNTNTKQYTPKDNFSNYTIKSNLYVDDCKISKSKLVTKNISENPGFLVNQTNQTVQVNQTNQTDQIVPINQTYPIDSNQSSINNISQNDSTITNHSSSNITSNYKCEYSFDINLKDNISTNRIKFSFNTNATNYSIQYWIEDYSGNIVKSKYTTTNTNTKQYTPQDKTDLYYIKAELHNKNCTLNASKLSIFHSDKNPSSQGNQKENNNKDEEEQFETTSYLEIIDPEYLLTRNMFYYEAYKGDTRKRTVYTYLNSHKINSFEMQKYSKIKGNLKISPQQGENTLVLKGLDIEKEYVFYVNNSLPKKAEKNIKSKQLQSLMLSNSYLSNNSLNFALNSTLNNSNILCYILYKRTKMTKTLNISTQNPFNSSYSLLINNTKLKKKENKTFYSLKLICKHRKHSSSYYSYKNYEFNYTMAENTYNKSNNTDIKNAFNPSHESISSYKTSSNFQKNQNLSYLLSNKPEKDFTKNSSSKALYTSKNYEISRNSFFAIFIGVIILLTLFIIRW